MLLTLRRQLVKRRARAGRTTPLGEASTPLERFCSPYVCPPARQAPSSDDWRQWATGIVCILFRCMRMLPWGRCIELRMAIWHIFWPMIFRSEAMLVPPSLGQRGGGHKLLADCACGVSADEPIRFNIARHGFWETSGGNAEKPKHIAYCMNLSLGLSARPPASGNLSPPAFLPASPAKRQIASKPHL